MAGIPTILHVALVWIPTFFSIILSFTDWNGIRFSDMEWVGFQNYVQIFTVFQKNFFQALINNTVLLIFLFIGPTALGIGLAYLLDRDVRGTRFYQGVFFTPVVLSLAVVGFMWQSVIYSPENGLATQVDQGPAELLRQGLPQLTHHEVDAVTIPVGSARRKEGVARARLLLLEDGVTIHQVNAFAPEHGEHAFVGGGRTLAVRAHEPRREVLRIDRDLARRDDENESNPALGQ
jgi:hypothetical protein